MGKKGKPRVQRPDEAFSSGPLNVVRFGLNIILESNWQESEFEKVQEKLVNLYPEVICEIDALISEVADLIAELPPEELLHRAYCEMMIRHINIATESDLSPDAVLSTRMLDYTQSVIVSVPPAHCQRQEVTEKEWRTLREKIGALFEKVNRTYQRCKIAKKKAGKNLDFNMDLEVFRWKAQVFWSNIRGKRYQVHEPAHLQHMFLPHSDVLQELFGISGKQFIDEIIKIQQALSLCPFETCDSMLYQAIEKKIAAQSNSTKYDLNEIITEDKIGEYNKDKLFGRILSTDFFDVQKTTTLPKELLKELTWSPGEDTEFFAEGEYRGWPLRVWPVFKRPFIRLNDRYYCFEQYSLFDNIYRVMQRIILRHKPNYRETWKNIQTRISENLPFEYFERLLPGAKVLKSVYYEGRTKTGAMGWCETDGLLIYDDYLFIIEAKGGAFTRTPPATNFQEWVKSLDELVLRPANQGKRFVEYLMGADKVPLFDKKHKQIGELCKSNFRHVVICVITIDPFTEIAAQVQHLHKIGMDIGTEPVWSMSVDDLQVYADVFENPLLFLHYVEQRMCAFQSDVVQYNSEIEHLGLYLKRNHYSTYIENMQTEFGTETTNLIGYSSDVDQFFYDRLNDPDTPCPLRQQTPMRILEIIQFLSCSSLAGRARIASCILDLNEEARKEISHFIDEELANQPIRKRARPLSTHGNNVNITVFCWRADCVRRDTTLALDHARSIFLINNDDQRLLLDLKFTDTCILEHVSWHWVNLSGIPQDELQGLQANAVQIRRDRVKNAKKQERKIGRNQSCPCGSGKKYKNCCIGQ